MALFTASRNKSRSKSRRVPAVPGGNHPDFSARLRGARQQIRSRVERRDTLLEVMRTVNSSLEPTRIAELAIDRAATWLPVSHWALVSADPTGQLSVLADRGLEPDMGPAIYAIAQWVMQRGEEFVTANLGDDGRVPGTARATVIAFPLSCRGRRVGALVAVDPASSSQEPRLPPALVRAVRVLLEPVAVALENALQLKRTEALSVTDDLT
ncbi:MAG TPA: hypothetical protein VJP86_03925, partial [Vicinamibacterales bacterium]|nr:hypothetical protein [Vicinamibacterales bacterium]